MQFSNEPKRCDHTEPCDNEGTNFQDCTCGPMYDPRWFCPVHIDEARKALHQQDAKRKLGYQRNMVLYFEERLAKEREKLAEMEHDGE